MDFLEDIDIKILDKKESLEINFKKTESAVKLPSGKNWWRVDAFIDGDEEFIKEKVDRVIYYTHPTFPENQRRIVKDHKQSKFALSLKVWGQFTLRAEVFLKNGERVHLAKIIPPPSGIK